MFSDITIILIIIILNVNTFLIGYLLGRSINSNGVNNNTKSFFQQNKTPQQDISSISIDDKKFVVDISTNGLQKKYDSLGDIKQTDDNITHSVNKLKNLKR